MDFQDLHAFVHVARQESYSRAAVELRIAQSALSRRVARLEHQLGAKLFERSGRGVRLTEAGGILLGRAELLMESLKTIAADVQCLAREPTGPVRIALPPTTSQILAPLLVRLCREKFPRISLYIKEGFSGFIHDWLMQDAVDIGLLYNPETSAEMEITPILNSPLHLIAPADWRPEMQSIGARELFTLPLILPSRSHSLRLIIERFAAEQGAQPQIVNEVDGMRATNALVEAGLGFTVFSYAAVYPEVLSNHLRIVPIDPPIYWQLSMVRRKATQPSRAVSEVQQIIEQQLHRLSERGLWQGNPIVSPTEKIGRAKILPGQ